jgi:hypothetical protein
MSNYIKGTDFAAKDSLSTGNPSKIVKGAELNSEFNAIQTAIATKADKNSPTFTGTPNVPTSFFGDNSQNVASTAFVQAAVRAMYPIGSLYINSSNPANPTLLFGFGTWILFAAGRTLVCIDTTNPIMNSPEEVFGRSDAINVSHSHGINDPSHTHFMSQSGVYSTGDNPPNTTVSRLMGTSTTTADFNAIGNMAGYITPTLTGISVQTSGADGANQNYQPSIAVYIWKRTA